MAVPPTSKAALRQVLHARRDEAFASMPVVERQSASEALAVTLVQQLARPSVVAAYIAIGSEIDPVMLVRALAADGCTIALPRVTSKREPMQFAAWSPDAPLVPGPFGLHQPPSEAPEIVPDAILAPLLGFDQSLNRIGYGAGHYDRAFAQHPDARRIGLAWDLQACEAIAVDPWDVPLKAVATEKAWYE
jgi:5-formyltetrahydrofolate cyclo-ligase